MRLIPGAEASGSIDQHSIPEPWRRAIAVGGGIALLHRLFFTVWMAAAYLYGTQILHITPSRGSQGALPPLKSVTAEALLGVWRGMDAQHYLNLAYNGYRPEAASLSVFGMLPPFLFRLLPGPLEVNALIIETLATIAAAILLYRLVEYIYEDRSLAAWTVVVLALHPLSYYLAAPMSDGLYLAFALGFVLAAYRERWWWAGILGLLATLTRHQGVMLVIPAALMLLKPFFERPFRTALRASPAFIMPPLGYGLFFAFRSWRGLPPMAEMFSRFDVYFVNPLRGLWLNLSLLWNKPLQALTSPNLIALIACLILLGVSVLVARHRHWPLIAYSGTHLLLFVSKVNVAPDGTIYTNSIARYSLALFPLIIVLADLIRRQKPRLHLASISVLAFFLLLFSAVYSLGYGPH